ncbi:hypothetical protein BG004_006777 [Podila humilis]|nr:hypothetical protein BG004_006777 [Podila humilis]
MRFFILSSTTPVSAKSSPSWSPQKRTAWSLLCTTIVASTMSGLASAALDPGFCGDCQTYANAIQPCGGSFTAADIEVPGEYVLQETLAKCICSAVIQKVLWTCAKCASFGGSKFQAVPPNKYQTQCMAWNTPVDQWNAPYTGIVAPGTQTDLGGGPIPPNTPPATTNPPATSTTPKPSGGGGGGTSTKEDGKGTSTDSSSKPTGSTDNSLAGGGNSTESDGPNGKVIGISVGIIGVAAMAGVVAVVMMKRRRRRRPLDLDSSPALANFMELDSHGGSGREKIAMRPASPPMVPAPVASATPAVPRGHRNYIEGGGGSGGGVNGTGGSVVGGYDTQYDHYGQGYDGYSHGQYADQYGDHYNEQYYDQGYYDQQQGYGAHDYGYDPAVHPTQGPQQPPHRGPGA